MLLQALIPTGKRLVTASGLAGWGRSDEIALRQMGPNVIAIGDGATSVGNGVAPHSPRVGIAAAMGAFVHAVPLEPKVFRTVWFMLYSLLYGTVLLFRLRIMNEPPKVSLYVLGALLWLLTIILLLRGSGWDIYVFALFAAVVLIPVFIRVFAQPDASPYLRRMLIAAALALAFQALKAVIPCGVVLGHVCLLAALVFAYQFAVRQDDAE